MKLTSGLMAGVDRAVFAAAFVDRLRRAGLAVSIHSAERLAAALELARPRGRTELYWTSRVCLLDDIGSAVTFDRVFDLVFAGGALPTGRDARKSNADRPVPPGAGTLDRLPSARSAADESGTGVPWASSPSVSLDDDHDADRDQDPIVLPELLPANLAAIAERGFDQLDEAQLGDIGRWLEQVRLDWPTVKTRRQRRYRRGRLDHRATLARARRSAGEPIELRYANASTRTRRVVMLADVSGSMQTFVRPYLHLMRALARQVDAEVFAFSTTLTRITPALGRTNPVAAIDRASELVDDRFGGTRIASSLGTLMSHPTWSTLIRGAVVVIASDGWDTDPVSEMNRRMARLARLSHRVVWINPRAAADEYQPLVAGMAAALPYCDTFCSGHSLAAMRRVITALAG